MKIPSANGICSSLWLFNYLDEQHNYEIDIELHGTNSLNSGNLRQALLSTWITTSETAEGSTHSYVNAPTALNDGQFHTYRIDWHTGANPRVEYYIDGVKLLTITDTVPQNEMYVNIGCWFPNGWCGKPNFETDTMVIRSFDYTPFAGETAGKQNTITLTPNQSSYYVFPQVSELPTSNLIADGAFDPARTGDKRVWSVPSGASITNGGITFTGEISQAVELDCGGLEYELDLSGTGSAAVTVTFGSIVNGVSVTGSQVFTFANGGKYKITPPDDCTVFTVKISATTSVTLTSARLTVIGAAK